MRNRPNRNASKSVDAQILRAMIGSQEVTTALGVVRKFPGETSHFFVDTDNGANEIMVDVELIPSGSRVACRLGFGNDGVYKIPRVDQEVAVLLPFDSSSLIKDPLDFDPIIVGVLDNDAPGELDGDDIVVLKADRVHVISGDIKLGANPNPLDEVVVGTGIDPFTGSTYKMLGNTSGKVKAEK
jgi:hypothetical protein